MDTVLLDTDAASFLFKGHPTAEKLRPHVEGKRVALSFMSVAELYRWSLERGWGQPRIARLEETLQRYVIVPYDSELARAWARIMARKGHPTSVADAWPCTVRRSVAA